MDAAEVKDMIRARSGGIAVGIVADPLVPSCRNATAASPVDSKSLQMGYSAEDLAAACLP
jgi:hypothetical protein